MRDDERLCSLLKQLYTAADKEDTGARDRQIREWRQLKLLWEGFNRIYYSEVAHDWRIYDNSVADTDSDQGAYDKPVNVFKAYLESLVAALSVTVPPIKCYPDDADDPLDLSTAKAGDKIAQLIYRHNDVSLLWLHLLFLFCTEGAIASYTYAKESDDYGTYNQNTYDESEQTINRSTCPSCGYLLSESPANSNPGNPPVSPSNPNANPAPSGNDEDELEDLLTDKFAPDDDDAKVDYALNEGQDLCPACMQQMSPDIQEHKVIVTRLIDQKTLPKSRVCIEIYGGLCVKVGNYARKQKDVPYLIFSNEIDYSLVLEEYTHLHSKIHNEIAERLRNKDGVGSYSGYGQWGRLSPQYVGSFPENVVTVHKIWLRPARFNTLPDEDDVKYLKKKFPDGVKVTIVCDEIADYCNENLDDCWTLLENPLSDYLHFEPLGKTLTSVQDITNDLISLVLQTIEHGIGQTFADSAVLDFNAYAQQEVAPGSVFPVKTKTGKSVKDAFFELRTATLSSEVLPFYNQIQSIGQVTSGALPSIFGGNLGAGASETASQYSMSRAQALQRLQNTWKMMTIFWKRIFAKAVPLYIENMQDDERDVSRDKSTGNFVNTLIRKAEVEGKIGKIELEANENLPMTWGQLKDTVEKLMINATPEAMKIIAAPENVTLIHDALGLVDFTVPDEEDVTKQYDEIKILVNSAPLPNPESQMNPAVPQEVPSVEVDPLIDNHAVQFEICRTWLISEVGRQTKIDNQPGYQNVLLHAKMHHDIMQSQMMPPPAPGGNGSAPPEKPSPNLAAPIGNEADLNVTH